MSTGSTASLINRTVKDSCPTHKPGRGLLDRAQWLPRVAHGLATRGGTGRVRSGRARNPATQMRSTTIARAVNAATTPPRPSPPHHPGAATLSACLHAAAASGGGGRARRAGRHPPLLARMPKGQRDWGRVDLKRSSKNLVWPAASLSAPLTRRDHSSGGDTGGNAAPLTGAVKGPSGVGNTCWHSLLGRLSVRLSAAGSPAWTGRLASGARTPVGGENGSLRASRDG